MDMFKPVCQMIISLV